MVSHVALYAGLLGDANWNRKQTEGMGVIPVRPYGCAPLGRPLWLASLSGQGLHRASTLDSGVVSFLKGFLRGLVQVSCEF